VSRPRTTARRIPAVAALVLVLVPAAGCGGLQSGALGRDSTDVPIDSISAEIEAELRQRDDVASVDVYYSDTFTVSATASADVTMKPGADPQVLNDEAVRLLWQSRLNPLSVISVNVTNPVDPVKGVSSSLNLYEEAERGPLERAYGPHPE
jgi:hypothetical protein